jgi:hypothetical protein
MSSTGLAWGIRYHGRENNPNRNEQRRGELQGFGHQTSRKLESGIQNTFNGQGKLSDSGSRSDDNVSRLRGTRGTRKKKEPNCYDQLWQHEPEIYPGGKFWQGQHRYSVLLELGVCPKRESRVSRAALRHGPFWTKGCSSMPRFERL